MSTKVARLTPLDATVVFAIKNGDVISEGVLSYSAFKGTAEKLLKRGLARKEGAKYVLTEAGEAAFKKWSGT